MPTGEHTIVYGQPALANAIDKRAFAKNDYLIFACR